MDIKLDKETMAEVVEQAKEQMVAALVAQFNVPQIAGEIRNAAIKEVAAEIAKNVKADRRIDEAVTRAVEGAQSRINDRIRNILESGIKVSFKDV